MNQCKTLKFEEKRPIIVMLVVRTRHAEFDVH